MNDTEKTAAELREQAAADRGAAQDSFERSDTDGFLTQWALGLSAQLRDTQASIKDAGGVSTFTGLYEGDRRVKARMVTFRDRYRGYGEKTMWLLHDDETALRTARNGKWLPIGESSRVQKALGVAERQETDKAWAKLDGRGRGLSGTAWVAIYRAGDKWGADAKLIDDGVMEV